MHRKIILTHTGIKTQIFLFKRTVHTQDDLINISLHILQYIKHKHYAQIKNFIAKFLEEAAGQYKSSEENQSSIY